MQTWTLKWGESARGGSVWTDQNFSNHTSIWLFEIPSLKEAIQHFLKVMLFIFVLMKNIEKRNISGNHEMRNPTLTCIIHYCFQCLELKKSQKLKSIAWSYSKCDIVKHELRVASCELYYVFTTPWLRLQQKAEWADLNFERRSLSFLQRSHPPSDNFEKFVLFFVFNLIKQNVTDFSLISFTQNFVLRL